MIAALKIIELQQTISINKINPLDCFYIISVENETYFIELFEKNKIELKFKKGFCNEPANIIEELINYCQLKNMYQINNEWFNKEDIKEKNWNFFVFTI